MTEKTNKTKTGVKTVKRLLITVCALLLVLTACQNSTSDTVETTTDVTGENKEVQSTVDGTAEIQSPAAENSYEALELEIIKYIEDEIDVLNSEFDELTDSISTYDKYVKNVGKVDAFYEKVSSTSASIALRLREYSVEYAELILDEDMTANDMYDAFKDMYDCIYDDASDVFYDGIYDGILKELYDAFYDGVVSDGMDHTSYGEWYDVSSEAYGTWYDTSSACYEHWYDMSSDVYGLIMDVQSELYNGDIDGAKDELADFEEYIEKLKNGEDQGSVEEETVEEETREEETTEEETSAEETKADISENLVDGMRSDFKTAMDSYEEFMNDYVDFMNKYADDPGNLSLLADYAKFMSKYSDFVEDFDAWEDEDLNAAETAYYIDVQARVSKKLLEIAE